MTTVTLGLFKISIKHSYLRNEIFYFQRGVPKDLHQRYACTLLKANLKTKSPSDAARKIDALNRQVEAEWEALREGRVDQPKAFKDRAERLLCSLSIKPVGDGDRFDAFLLELESQAHQSPSSTQINPVGCYRHLQVEALPIVDSTPKVLVSELPNIYLSNHQKGENSPKLVYDVRRVMNSVIECSGDIPLDSYSRKDAIAFRDAEVAKRSKTGTVRRKIRTASAVFAAAILELELNNKKNPFAAIKIIGEGLDTKKKDVLTMDDLSKVQAQTKEKDDCIRWIIAMQSDLGCRISEVVGLALQDIVLDAPIPYVDFKRDLSRGRDIKEDVSIRKVPLVGYSLWAAQRIKERAIKGQRYAFPKYCDDKEVLANSADATINRWLRSTKRGLSGSYTSHCFRHSMADRLREVQCPEDIRLLIGGWKVEGEGANYGEGYSLRVMKEWLERTVLDKPS